MSKKKWFKKTRGSYLPTNIYGTILYIPYIGYLLWSVIYVAQLKYSLGLSILIIVPNWTAAFIIMNYVAGRKS